MLDYIIWNLDRHGGNFLVKEEKMYAIDNGLSFGRDSFGPYSRDTLFDFAVPKDLILKCIEIVNNEKMLEIMKISLEEHLPEDEINACIWRIKNLVKILGDKRIGSEIRKDVLAIKSMLTYEKN